MLRKVTNNFATYSSKFCMDLEDQYGCHNYAPLPVVIDNAKDIYMYDCEGMIVLRFREKIFRLSVCLFCCKSRALPSQDPLSFYITI